MPFQMFENENLANGLSPNSAFQVGVSDLDPTGTPPEKNILLPFAADAQATWIYYECALECRLDSGIVVHRYLPQYDNDPDTLASCDVGSNNIDALTGLGVNLKSNDQFSDFVQKMAHSRYWFRLFGQALRVGQQVPIPGLKKVGKQDAIPYDEVPQTAYNYIWGNYSGQVVYRAVWSLWYTLAAPPSETVAPVPANLAAHAGEDDTVGKGPQSPVTQPDDEAVNAIPSTLLNPIQ